MYRLRRYLRKEGRGVGVALGLCWLIAVTRPDWERLGRQGSRPQDASRHGSFHLGQGEQGYVLE
jgi:hypothetical protein